MLAHAHFNTQYVFIRVSKVKLNSSNAWLDPVPGKSWNPCCPALLQHECYLRNTDAGNQALLVSGCSHQSAEHMVLIAGLIVYRKGRLIGKASLEVLGDASSIDDSLVSLSALHLQPSFQAAGHVATQKITSHTEAQTACVRQR